MSYEVTIDDEEKTGGQVATNFGWSTFCRWLDGLDAPLKELRHFAEYGWSQDLPQLRSDLQDAIAEDSKSKDNVAIAKGLLKMLQGKQDEVAVLHQ